MIAEMLTELPHVENNQRYFCVDQDVKLSQTEPILHDAKYILSKKIDLDSDRHHRDHLG